MIEYLIDAANRRVGKKVNGVKVQGFLYQSALRPVAELDGNDQVVSFFVYGDNPNVPEYMERGGTKYRLITDHLGSVRLVVNTIDGTIAQRIDYDEWGNVTQDTNPGFQPFGFAGGLRDPDAGTIRLGARDYDASTARWTAPDPIGFAGGDGNLYADVGGDPINRIDPRVPPRPCQQPTTSRPISPLPRSSPPTRCRQTSYASPSQLTPKAKSSYRAKSARYSSVVARSLQFRGPPW